MMGSVNDLSVMSLVLVIESDRGLREAMALVLQAASHSALEAAGWGRGA